MDTKNIRAVFLTMSNFDTNVNALTEIDRVKERPFKIFALSQYADYAEKYRSMGVDYVFEYRENLGKDFVTNTLKSNSFELLPFTKTENH